MGTWHKALLLALIALTVGVRLGMTFVLGNPEQTAMEYGNIAFHLVHGHGYAISLNHWWPVDPPVMTTRWMMPFYPLLLAVSKIRSPGSYLDVYVLQSVLAGATVYILFRVGSRVYGTRPALFSAALFCFYPSLVYYSARPHPLYWELTALLLALWACHAYAAQRKTRYLVGCALATLWATYIRSAWVLLVPVLIVLMGLTDEGWRLRWRAALLFGAIVALGVSPWAARNYVVFRSPGLTALDFPFWEGHNSLGMPTGYGPDGSNVSNVRIFHPREWDELRHARDQGEAAIMSVFRRAALREIRERPWLHLVTLPAKRVGYFFLWDPNHPKTGDWPRYRVPYLCLFASAIAGLAWSWRRPGVAWRFGLGAALGVWATGCATVAVFHYLFRYRLPAELTFMLPAGYFADRVLSWVGGRVRPQARHPA